MKKEGFTLIELLVVIAIIAILSVIIVPSVITVNKNVNERLYEQKEESIISAAELYASNNPDIFNGADKVYVYVYQLIDADYLKVDSKYGQTNCSGTDVENISKGCIIDPRTDSDSTIMNNKKILLTKKAVGVVGQFDDGNGDVLLDSDTLVNAVCKRFENNTFTGLSLADASSECECVYSDEAKAYTSLSLVNGTPLGANSACIIVSDADSGNVNNWLKYGSSEANWRVLGIYSVDGVLYPKMITADVIN